MKSLVKTITKIISWVKSRKRSNFTKRINLSTILNYAEAEFRYWQYLSESLPQHITEQSIYRASEIKKKSPICLEQSQCVHCGCSFPEKLFEQDGCEKGCYGERLNEKDWNVFKKENNIKIS